VDFQVRGKNGKMRSMAGPVPLELKTGKTTFSAEHKGQVMLLILVMALRWTRGVVYVSSK